MNDSLLRRLLLGCRPESPRVYECRRCGTTLDTDGADCPYCGPTDVATYDIV